MATDNGRVSAGMDARTWMAECTATFLRTVDGLTGEQLAGPSLLPGCGGSESSPHSESRFQLAH